MSKYLFCKQCDRKTERTVLLPVGVGVLLIPCCSPECEKAYYEKAQREF